MVLTLCILEYYCLFTYEKVDLLIWSDNFQLSQDWPVLEIRKLRKIIKTYKNKKPFNRPYENSTVSLYHKTRWICLNEDTCTGTVIKCTKDKLDIKGLKITKHQSFPHIVACSFPFDLEILMLLLMNKDGVHIHGYKVQIEDMYIECSTSFIKTKHKNLKFFRETCEQLREEYIAFEPKMKKLYEIANLTLDYENHQSIAPITWHKAKRENQTEWPKISKKKIDETSIEFPKNSGIWYTGEYVGLARRHDDCPEIYIPKLYKTNHKILPNTILYKYMHGEKEIQTKIKEKEIKLNDEIECEWQILDENANRKYIFTKKSELIYSPGKRLLKAPALPWHYKQIIHDYNKLNRLKYGNVQDLMHIGIVDPDSKDIITFPFDKNKKLFQGKILETHRLCTFKYQQDVEITRYLNT